MLRILVLPVHYQQTSQSLLATSAAMLQGQGTLQACQVDTAVRSETKVSRDVRRKEALKWVEFGPRRSCSCSPRHHEINKKRDSA